MIDDDIELCKLLSDFLSSEGFGGGRFIRDEEGAIQALAKEYALVVLDVMLPATSWD